MSDTKTPRRGRKHGSSDSVNVSIATLVEHLKLETVVPVRRKWLEEMERFLNVRILNETPEVAHVEELNAATPARQKVVLEETFLD